MNITDKNCAAAILNAIGALAEKLTGLELCVKLSDDDGNFVWIRPTLSDTKWVKALERQAPMGDPLVECSSKPSGPRQTPDDTHQMLRQSVLE